MAACVITDHAVYVALFLFWRINKQARSEKKKIEIDDPLKRGSLKLKILLLRYMKKQHHYISSRKHEYLL